MTWITSRSFPPSSSITWVLRRLPVKSGSAKQLLERPKPDRVAQHQLCQLGAALLDQALAKLGGEALA